MTFLYMIEWAEKPTYATVPLTLCYREYMIVKVINFVMHLPYFDIFL